MKEIRGLEDFEPESQPPTPDDMVWSPPVVADYLQWLDTGTSRSANGAAQGAAPVAAPTGGSGLLRRDDSLASQKAPSGLWRSDASMPSQTGASRPARPANSVPLSADASVPLTRLMSSAVPIEWHHAVAVVQQLIDQLAPDRSNAPAGSVPPIEAIRLDSSGRLRVELGPAEEPFARGLGRVLARLLESNPAPASLRLLALETASGSAAPMAFDDLARQIAGWERPGRAAALSALYAQALAVPDGAYPVAPALPVVEPAARPVAKKVASPKRFIEALRRNPAIVYIAVVFCLAAPLAAFGVYSLFGPNPAPVVDTPTASESTPSPTSSPASQDIELKRTAARRTGRPATADIAAVTSGQAAPEPVADLIADEVEAGPVEAKPDESPFVTLETRSNGALALTVSTMLEAPVFTSGDAGVSEPILVRPYLPPKARVGTPSALLGVLEVMIDTNGAVETVHLYSPGNRYRDRWWLFAAKQWQFTPALRNGQPVKFLKRIPLTDLNVLEPQ
jgi:hypothetical protein